MLECNTEKEGEQVLNNWVNEFFINISEFYII